MKQKKSNGSGNVINNTPGAQNNSNKELTIKALKDLELANKYLEESNEIIGETNKILVETNKVIKENNSKIADMLRDLAKKNKISIDVVSKEVLPELPDFLNRHLQ